MKKLLCVAAAVTAVFVFCSGSAAVPVCDMCGVSAEHACVVELNTARLICGKNEYERASMASTTKIMTALLLCENADLDKEITVSDSMLHVEGSSMGLLAGDRAHYRDLLYGLLLASGNDAANVIAISVAGSLEKFAEMMNERAAVIGMKDTNFVTPSGLDDENHYTTAYDMALLACEAMKNTEFAKACGSKSAVLEYGDPPYKRTLTNHNKLLNMYDDCVGVKTGFTKKSGRCLVSCAVKDGKGVVAVTLNAPDDWNDHIRMLDYGLSKLESRQLNIPELPDIPVIGAKSGSAVTARAPTVSLVPEDFERLTVEIKTTDTLFAPVKPGENAGCISWKLDGVTVASADIVTSMSVPVSDDPSERNIIYWFRRLLSA